MLKPIMLAFGIIVIGNLLGSGSFVSFLCLSIMWMYALYRE